MKKENLLQRNLHNTVFLPSVSGNKSLIREYDLDLVRLPLWNMLAGLPMSTVILVSLRHSQGLMCEVNFICEFSSRRRDLIEVHAWFQLLLVKNGTLDHFSVYRYPCSPEPVHLHTNAPAESHQEYEINVGKERDIFESLSEVQTTAQGAVWVKYGYQESSLTKKVIHWDFLYTSSGKQINPCAICLLSTLCCARRHVPPSISIQWARIHSPNRLTSFFLQLNLWIPRKSNTRWHLEIWDDSTKCRSFVFCLLGFSDGAVN